MATLDSEMMSYSSQKGFIEYWFDPQHAIQTPESNQSSQSGSGHCSSLVGLSLRRGLVWLVGQWFMACPGIVSHLVLEKST